MNLEVISPVRSQPLASPSIRGYSIIVILAFAALGVLVYLFRRALDLSAEGKKIRASFKNAPESLSNLDLYDLARKVESISVQKMLPTERYKIELFSGLLGLWGRKKYLISKGADNTPRVQYVEKTLGQGGFGKVTQLVDLHTGSRTALKVAKTPKAYNHDRQYLEKAQEDLRKEHTNLMLLHDMKQQKKEPRGIQDKPLTFVLTIIKQYNSKSKVSLGFEGRLYKGSLDKLDVARLPFKIRLQIALQVLQGMRTLLRNELINHDLKPQNILYREGIPQNPFVVHLSDLGGVTHHDKLGDELGKGLSHTPGFGNTESINLAASIPIGFVQRKLVKDSEKGTIGFTICWILTGDFPDEKNTIEQRWKQAGLSQHKDLLKALKQIFDRGLFTWLFRDNVKSLKKEVQKTLKQLTK